MNIARALVFSTLIVCASASMWDTPELIAQPRAQPSMWDAPELVAQQHNATLIEPKQAIGDVIPSVNQTWSSQQCTSKTCNENTTTADAISPGKQDESVPETFGSSWMTPEMLQEPQKITVTPPSSTLLNEVKANAADDEDSADDDEDDESAEDDDEEAEDDEEETADDEEDDEEEGDVGADDTTEAPEAPTAATDSTQAKKWQGVDLKYTTFAELAVELGLVTKEDAQDGVSSVVFDSPMQRKLFNNNRWSVLDGTKCKTKMKVDEENRSQSEHYVFPWDTHTEFSKRRSYTMYPSPWYIERSSTFLNTYHILGYLDQSTRLIRLNDDPQDIFIARFKTYNGEEFEKGLHRRIQLADQATRGDVVEYTIEVPEPSMPQSTWRSFLVEMTVESLA